MGDRMRSSVDFVWFLADTSLSSQTALELVLLAKEEMDATLSTPMTIDAGLPYLRFAILWGLSLVCLAILAFL